MTACTDDERRRVAERLRRLNVPSLIAMMSILDVGGRDLCSRLADLIEPSCDRDALLALADEIETVNCPDYGEWDMVVRRIREALGVSE